MARYQQQRKVDYPMGSVSSGTMRNEDLIPTFCAELDWRAQHDTHVSAKDRRVHRKLVRDIEYRLDRSTYFASDSDNADSDLSDLFDALNAYAAPYFYFGAHPGDGADYGYWLSESWDEDFELATDIGREDPPAGIKVNDLAEVPSWYRGEVAVVSDHGNVSLYVKTSRSLREIWSVV